MRLPASILALFLLACALPGAALAKVPLGPPPDPTLHLYRETIDGGMTLVVGDHDVSKEFISRLRSQLHKEATAYGMGKYPGPDARTHVAANTLSASAGRIAVIYTDVPRGGKIVFKTRDAHLVDALHAWMAATVRYNQHLHHDGGPGTYPLNDDDDDNK